ncbi:MAG TPA: TonB-dependent receptor [Kofleriaceae bacterium]|nr:TonB-dependent receptor [Kofleriaceae bacterium]
MLGATPGAQNDGYGTAFAGATSLENRYTIDGIDVTGITYGNVGQPVLIEFIDQVRAISGGAGPDVATSTGAPIEAVTKHGTNDWHGSVFATYSPSWLVAPPKPIPTYPQTISATSDLAYAADAGGTLSGPIVKDHLWFFAGFAPFWTRTDYTRTVRMEVDRDQNGVPDVDPKTGFPITQVVDTQIREAPTTTYNTIARIDGAVTPEHQGTLTAIVTPYRTANPAIIGVASAGTRTDELTTDLGAHWRSRWLDDRIELEASFGWHRDDNQILPYDPSLANTPQILDSTESFASIAKYESATAQEACADGGRGDPYPLITNCPGPATYFIGGPGLLLHDIEDRKSARVAVSARVEALGEHVMQISVEGESRESDLAKTYSGGYYQYAYPGLAMSLDDWFVRFAPPGTTDPRFDRTCEVPATSPGAQPRQVACEYVTSLADGEETYTATDEAAFVRDVWRVKPNLLIDAGIRYEDQHIEYGSAAATTALVLTGEQLPSDLIHVDGEIAPRVGVTYDPTNDGRSSLFAHWGRYFEQVPLDIAELTGGIASYQESTGFGPLLYSQAPLRAAPDLRGEYSDELIVGARRAFGSTVVTASVQDRRLGRAIEDVALYGTSALTLANPGEGPAHIFDRPTRDYDALELSIARRFSRLYVLASYTYSRTYGDYPGSISYLDNDVQPNASTQYDQIELLANRLGLLPQDRPHYLKLDASYTTPFGQRTSLVIGGRLRALSGTPELALAPSYYGGTNESILLPQAAFGRTPFTEQLDMHVELRRQLAHGMTAQLYVDVLNVFDQQATYQVDNAYASGSFFNAANPISGGSYSDAIWAKQVDLSDGLGTNQPIARNPDFHKPTAYYAPLTARLGFRLSF